MNKILKVLLLLLLIAVIVWAIPVKIFISRRSLESRAKKLQGDTVLVCEYQAVTGPIWRVQEFYGTADCPKEVDIIGNDIPELRLKKPIYEYQNCKFVFKGNFDKESKSLFLADDWDIIAPVFNSLYCLPYGVNIFQYNFNLTDEKREENEKATRELHKQYEADGLAE